MALLAGDVLLLTSLLAIRYLSGLGRRKVIIRVIIHGIDIRMKSGYTTRSSVDVLILALAAETHQVGGRIHHVSVRVHGCLCALAHIVASVILRVLSSVCI